VLGVEILHRDTKRIKLNRNQIIIGKLPNRKKVFNDVRSNKNVIETKGTRKNRVASTKDW
jgi:hypothetical protein